MNLSCIKHKNSLFTSSAISRKDASQIPSAKCSTMHPWSKPVFNCVHNFALFLSGFLMCPNKGQRHLLESSWLRTNQEGLEEESYAKTVFFNFEHKRKANDSKQVLNSVLVWGGRVYTKKTWEKLIAKTKQKSMKSFIFNSTVVFGAAKYPACFLVTWHKYWNYTHGCYLTSTFIWNKDETNWTLKSWAEQSLNALEINANI